MTALVPYLYPHALESGRTGRPITKPLVFNYPEDPRVKDLWEEFLARIPLFVREGAKVLGTF